MSLLGDQLRDVVRGQMGGSTAFFSFPLMSEHIEKFTKNRSEASIRPGVRQKPSKVSQDVSYLLRSHGDSGDLGWPILIASAEGRRIART